MRPTSWSWGSEREPAPRRPILLGTEGFFVPGVLAGLVAELLDHGATRLRQNEMTLRPELAEVITVARIAGQRNAVVRLSGTSGILQVDPSVRVDPEMMTTAQVATLCGCSARNVTGLANRGTLQGRRHPHRRGWFFHPDDVAAFLAAREERA